MASGERAYHVAYEDFRMPVHRCWAVQIIKNEHKLSTAASHDTISVPDVHTTRNQVPVREGSLRQAPARCKGSISAP